MRFSTDAERIAHGPVSDSRPVLAASAKYPTNEGIANAILPEPHSV
jgi:hypothetical protein